MRIIPTFALVLLSSFVALPQAPATKAGEVGDRFADAVAAAGVFTLPAVPGANISSTTTGGPWSAPSTWVGGIVPAAGDNVTIVNGATVIIDSAAAANSVMVGGTDSISGGKSIFTEGTSPAALIFGETGAFSLTVTADVTIGPNSSFTTGGGNANQHVLTVGGNLTNNGTLDFSTNNGLAAAMLVFTGASNTTFGGSGPVTDISWITLEKGATRANILELSVANFSVRGSTTDTPDSGFLFLNHGTFKISGTFTLSNRTFFTTPYEIADTAGLWLNNPNYTIVARPQTAVSVYGDLRVTQGTYNVGTEMDDSLLFESGSNILIEGGNINAAGRIMENLTPFAEYPFTYYQTGGIVTSCTVGQTSADFACFDLNYFFGVSDLAGGRIVIQNSTPGSNTYHFRYSQLAGLHKNGTVLQFGNELTTGAGTFRNMDEDDHLPDLVIYENRTARLAYADTMNIEIRPGAKLEYFELPFAGDSLVNNGTIKTAFPNTSLYFVGENQVYSGSGTTEGPLDTLSFRGNSLTLEQTGVLRARNVEIAKGSVINSDKLTIGNNDGVMSRVSIWVRENWQTFGFDTHPNYELGTGGLWAYYGEGTASGRLMTTGKEIDPTRSVAKLTFFGPNAQPASGLVIADGDLTVFDLDLREGVVYTGPNKIIHTGPTHRETGYVDGTIERKYTWNGDGYTYHIGQNGYSPVTVLLSGLGVNPSFLSIKPVDGTLPGLLPANSASRHWVLQETGGIAASMIFTYTNADTRGSEPNYSLWYSTGGPPVVIGGVPLPNSNTVSTPAGLVDFTGTWGIGGQLDPGPVSISGSVTTSGGQPIRNATLTLTGGGLQTPISIQTGTLGTYAFNSLQAGEPYTVRVDGKRYRFAQATQLVTPMSNVSNINFTANPQE
jgi:hypothetical protein